MGFINKNLIKSGGLKLNEIKDTLDAIKTAIQMEKDGYAFYKKAAAQTSSNMGKTIFESLSQDELNHLDVFQKIFENKISKYEFNTLKESSKKYESINIYPKDLKEVAGINPDTNELDALKMGLDSEKAAIDYYTKIKDASSSNEVKEIIDIIIEQEKNHYQILQSEFTHLSSTGYWYELDFLGG
jgi:rubrerythrin